LTNVPIEEKDNVGTDRRNELLNFVQEELEKKDKVKK